MKKINIILVVSIVIVILAIVCIFLVVNKTVKKEEYNGELKAEFLIDSNEEIKIDDYVIFKDYKSFHNIFKESNLSKTDFENYNLLVFGFTYDTCSESNIKPTISSFKNGNLEVEITYYKSCGVCVPAYMYYYIKIDKKTSVSDFKYTSVQTNQSNCDPYVAYKPIIYLYPTIETNVNIRLLNSNYLTTTYPKYNNLWNVTAYPDGKIISNGREYYGLYWEGINYNAKMTDEGFIVKGEDVVFFLEDKLKVLGLNDREADEFIIYWLPKLEKNKYNYIRFASINEINNYMPLDVTPMPDSIIRIMMEYKPLTEKMIIKEQKLSTPKREGFTLVEWGGSLIK